MDRFRPVPDAAMKKVVREIELESDQVVLDVAFEKAAKTETDRINMGAFAQVFGKAEVTRDRQDIENRKRMFAAKKDPVSEEGQRRGKILEAILTEQIDLNEWFGADVVTQQTSEFDDVFCGVDMVIKFPERNGVAIPPLLVDFTTSMDKRVLQEKLFRIAGDVRQGRLGAIKYNQTPKGKAIGPLESVPKILLVLDPSRMTDLARAWVQGKQRTLQKHPARSLLLYEIKSQLESQMKLAVRFRQPKALEILSKSHAWVSELIREQKIEIPEDRSIERKQNNPYQFLQDTFNDQFDLWREPLPRGKQTEEKQDAA